MTAVYNSNVIVVTEWTNMTWNETTSMVYTKQSSYAVPSDKDMMIKFDNLNIPFNSMYLSMVSLKIPVEEFSKEDCLSINVPNVYITDICKNNFEEIDLSIAFTRLLQYNRLKNIETDSATLHISGLERLSWLNPLQLIIKYYKSDDGKLNISLFYYRYVNNAVVLFNAEIIIQTILFQH